MDPEIRPVTAGELRDFIAVESAAFGVPERLDDELADAQALLELERTVAVFDGGRPVAVGAALSWELTLPGPVVVPAAAVTYVAVLPTHRRQGLLTAMMRRLLEQATGRAEPLAVLLASESVIYGRFGYGPAVSSATVEIERRHAAFTHRPPVPGRLRMLAPDEASAVLPAAYERYRVTQPGEVSRSAGWWSGHLADPEWRRDAASTFYHVVHERPGEGADGYATYRLRPGPWSDALADFELEITELVAVDPGVRAVLWAFCLDVDLVGTVRALNSPLDDPLRWMLTDPRRLRSVAQSDSLWLRVLDPAAALGSRRYQGQDTLVLDLTDAFMGTAAGRYRLEAAPDASVCSPTDAAADLRMSVAELGAALLGGVRFATLARAGRVAEATPGALSRADALFASDPVPFSTTDF